jgi:BirA family biotin operon repressor/biotin-[acetyl-CoA-carboxylase] ligase
MSEALARGGVYDGVGADAIAVRLDLPRVVALETTTSTLDVAHALAAEGAPAGTLVIAESQTAGRGRSGKRWTSAAGSGIWLTIIERSLDPATLSLLALRLGIVAATALQPFATWPIGIKWPNDLYVGGGKLAGILVEARWRESAPDWVAVGMGINVVAPRDIEGAAQLAHGTSRLTVLDALVPALRSAAARGGALAADELATLAARDIARGRRAVSPGQGIVDGVSAEGELLLRLPNGTLVAHRAGSLVFAEDAS